MGKRSNFKKNKHDAYDTPPVAVVPLLPYISGYFTEPCAGSLQLVNFLEMCGLNCEHASDIAPRAEGVEKQDALQLEKARQIITNPPWTREILHPMVEHFRQLAPTWLLLDADWAYTFDGGDHLDYCSHILAIGRVKWIPGSKHSGKDNCAWYRFQKEKTQTIFMQKKRRTI